MRRKICLRICLLYGRYANPACQYFVPTHRGRERHFFPDSPRTDAHTRQFTKHPSSSKHCQTQEYEKTQTNQETHQYSPLIRSVSAQIVKGSVPDPEKGSLSTLSTCSYHR